MKTIVVDIVPANDVVNHLFKTKPFVASSQKGSNRDFEWHCSNSLLTKECEALSYVSVLAFTLKADQNAPFSNFCIFISVFEQLRFYSGAM